MFDDAVPRVVFRDPTVPSIETVDSIHGEIHHASDSDKIHNLTNH